MDVLTQLAIIAEEESAAIYHFTLLMLGGLAVVISFGIAVKFSPDTTRRRAFWVLLASTIVLSVYAIVKPEVKFWPEGVTDNGSIFDTNEWRYVEFKWKLREVYPEDVPLKFWRKTTGGDWSPIGEEQSGVRVLRIYSGTVELPDNPTNYIYKVTSGYVPEKLPSIELVTSSASNVTIKVVCATNYFGYSAIWQARRQIWADSHFPTWGPWTDISQSFFFDETETNRTVSGSFVNGRKNTEIRLKMELSDEGSNGVRP